MKKYSYIGIAFIILIFGIYAIPKIVAKLKPPQLITIAKVPPFKFTNQDGKLITNSFYKDKVYVVEFFFTTCPTICPKMNENMVKIQNEFYGNNEFGIASFSINPTHDTPQILKEYAKSHGATLKNWNFLTGDQDKIYELANTGFTLFAGENSDAEGGFEHSGMFALVDKQGNIRSRLDEFGNPIAFYDGLDPKGVQMIKEDIAILLNE
ncbi:photosynthetic protein synthase II [Lutibacter profundi]|uniref:Photosynthetic protein synthase II n=1 Tax=Lutibacter profundi TaxID=1622118 RepID=A0A0X8G6N3_9FLAO|nr:SCO family protein [Lutibacter profundi]AMC11014.1 photosynthetic protein synthase II [Lutibacter profundi]